MINEKVSRHRQVMNLETSKPIISSDVFLAPNASVIGNVEVQTSASVWYGAVIRGDTAPVEIGERSSVGDRAVIRGASRVANSASVGPGAVIDGADVGSNTVIGAGTVLSPGVVIGSGSVVRPGSYLPYGVKVGENEVWAGTPAQKIDMLSETEKQENLDRVERTVTLASAHALECGKSHEQLEAEALRQTLMEERSGDYNSHLGLLGQEQDIVEKQARIIEAEREEQRKIGTA